MILNKKHYESIYCPYNISDFLDFNPRFFRFKNNVIGGFGIDNYIEFIKFN